MINIVVFNNTQSTRRFVLYQSDSENNTLDQYAWDSRLIEAGGSWSVNFPLESQVAGRIQNKNSQNYTQTQVEIAKPMDSWMLLRTSPDLPLMIKPGTGTQNENAIAVSYTKGPASVNAVLMKQNRTLLGKYLTVDSKIEFNLSNHFNIGITENIKRGCIINNEDLFSTCAVDTSNNEWVSCYQIIAKENHVSNDVEFTTKEMMIKPLLTI